MFNTGFKCFSILHLLLFTPLSLSLSTFHSWKIIDYYHLNIKLKASFNSWWWWIIRNPGSIYFISLNFASTLKKNYQNFTIEIFFCLLIFKAFYYYYATTLVFNSTTMFENSINQSSIDDWLSIQIKNNSGPLMYLSIMNNHFYKHLIFNILECWSKEIDHYIYIFFCW